MQKILTAAEMREIDRLTTEKYAIPSLLLMENAAHAAARVIAEKLGGSVTGKNFLILCGKGNNGGDGAALARILWTMGADVFVSLNGTVKETKGDARTNFEIIKKISESEDTNAPNENCLFLTESENPADFAGIFSTPGNPIIVDAFFGTGLSKPVTGELESFFARLPINKKHFELFVSLDLPSGLNADLAEPIGAKFQADLTVTFTAPKPANVLPPASRASGELVTVNIGSPPELIDDAPSQLFLAEVADVEDWLQSTKFTPDSFKKTRGHVLVIAGSKEMSGAAVLNANAAMMSGAGLVRVVTPESAQTGVASRTMSEILVAGVPETAAGTISLEALPKIEELSDKVDAVCVGSGLSASGENVGFIVRQIVERRKSPVVLDADALTALAPFDVKGTDELPLILTPHIGEMRRLLGVDAGFDFSDRVSIVREFAQKHHVILLLKGERNLVAAPDGTVVINPTGNSALGKAGGGDTLAGIIAGFLAQTHGAKQTNYFAAVVSAVYLSGAAGDIAAREMGQRTMNASNVRDYLGAAFRELEQ